jgi:DNA repair photolyase
MDPNFKQVKQLLKRARMVEPMFACNYAFSPYRGCCHNCIYCDGRAEKYYVEGDFGTQMTVRTNAPEKLAKELTLLKEPGMISLSSGVSDAYQPIEGKYRLTGKCAEVLARYRFGVFVLTKSHLVEKDLPHWQKVHENSVFTLAMSITTTDSKLGRALEPGASSVLRRLESLSKFKEKGLKTGVMAMPFVPGLSDSESGLRDLYGKLRDIKVDFVIPGLMTLRPGRQKQYFIEKMQNIHPEILPMIERLYRENRQSGIPDMRYCKKKMIRANALLREYGLTSLIPHHIYKRCYAKYDQMALLLMHMKDLYEARGINVTPLNTAKKLYLTWLEKEKETLYKKRSSSYQELEEKFLYVLNKGDFALLLQNQKLADFFKDGLLNDGVFDYQSLKWIG